MKLKSITISGIRNASGEVKYQFDDGINFVVGPNGAGKSTVLIACQLALLGYIPHTNAAIMRNTSSNVISVTAEIEDAPNVASDNIVKLTRVWVRQGTGISCHVTVEPKDYEYKDLIDNLEVPIFSFKEFLGLSANSQKDFFIKNILNRSTGASNISEQVDKKLEMFPQHTSEMQSEMKSELKGVSNRSAMDQVTHMHSWVKDVLKGKKIELDQVERAIQKLIFYEDVDESKSEEELRDEIAEYHKMIVDVREFRHKKMVYDKYQEKMQEYADDIKKYGKYTSIRELPEVKKVEKMQKEHDAFEVKMEAEIAECKKKADAIYERLNKLRVDIKLESSIVEKGSVCPYVNHSCEDLAEHVNNAQTKLAELKIEESSLQSKIDEINKKISDAEIAIEDSQFEINNLTNTVVRKAKETYERITVIMHQIPKKPEKDLSHIDETSLHEEIASREDTIAKIIANNSYKEMVEQFNFEQVKKQAEIGLLREMEKFFGPNGLQTDLMVEPFKEFSEKSRSYVEPILGESSSIGFHLSPTAHSFSFGLNLEDRHMYIPYESISSGEKCMFMLMLLACMIKSSGSAIKVLLIDDMLDHLDEDNVKKVVSQLKDVANNDELQYIIAGVNLPHDAGVNIIQV